MISSSSAMAPSELTFLALFLSALIFTATVKADGVSSVDGLDVAVGGGSDLSDSSALKIQVDHLKSKIISLESLVDEKLRDLKAKDELIMEKEKLLQEKLDKVSSLEDEVSSLQAHARAGDLEKQIEKLQQDLKSQEREKETLESRINKADKSVQELNSKLEKLEQINNEQMSKIRKTERALKIAEEEMLKAKFEATSKINELSEVHGAWLPPWLVSHLIHSKVMGTLANGKSLVEKHWNEHGKPAMNVIVTKTVEKKLHAKKWAEPHIETIKTKWVPAVKEQWLVLTTWIEPYMKVVHSKSIDYYEASKTAITPHAIKLQQVVDPYYQDAKKLCKPYIDQVATTAKPHVDRVRVALKPHTAHMVHVYSEFLKCATSYHNQVQASVGETLKKHEITRALATKEFEWFAASAILALPIIMVFRVCSGIFCKKTKKPSRHSHAAHHGRRKGHKRGHSEK